MQFKNTNPKHNNTNLKHNSWQHKLSVSFCSCCLFACIGLSPAVCQSAKANQSAPKADENSASKAAPKPKIPQFNPDRPGIADGSTLVGPHKFQIETGVQSEEHKDGDNHTRLIYTPTLFRYGLDNRYELRIESMGYQQARYSAPGTDTLTTRGYSPVSLGVKVHLQDSKPSNNNVSLGTILRVFPKSGSSDFRTNQTTGDLRLAADWTLSSLWNINPNVGVGFYQDETGKQYTSFLLPVTVNYNINPQMTVFLEPALQTPEQHSGGASLIYDTGITYIFNGNTQLDFSIGTGASGQTPPHPFLGAGISRRF